MLTAQVTVASDTTEEERVSSLIDSDGSSTNLKYKKPIMLNPITPLDDFQISIELTASNFDYSKVNPNGSDIRFHDIRGNKLPYWIEEWNITGTSTIWIKVPGQGTSQIDMYYGNPSATSESNGDNTFVFFDDFEGSELDTNKWSETYNYPVWTVSNSILSLRTSDSTPQWKEAGIKAPEDFSHDFRAIAKVKGHYRNADLRFYCVLGEPTYLLGLKIAYWGTLVYAYTTDSGDVSLVDYPSDSPWVRCMITKVGSRSQFYWDDFETPVYQEDDGWSDSYSHTRIGTTWQRQNVYCDYVFITKYADLEPIATIGTETTVNAVSDCIVIKSPGYYFLTGDIRSESYPCINITTSNVIFDGNGHTLEGSGFGRGISVYNSSTMLSNVTIKNIEIEDWDEGIYFSNVRDSTVENTETYSNDYSGIYLDTSNNIILSNNTADYNRYGIELHDSWYNTIVNNTVYENDDDGIYLENSDNNSIQGTTVYDNGDMGIYLKTGSDNNTISNNQIYDTRPYSNHYVHQGYGLYLAASTNNIITDNTVYNQEQYGIALKFAHNNSVTHNTVYNNKWQGICLLYSNNTLIYNNLFNNTDNIYIKDSTNTWNITKTPGTNILGGIYFGGNAWLKPDGSGFCQTCRDDNNDGICDAAHKLDNYNVDYLPLTVTETSSVSSCMEINTPGYYVLTRDLKNCTAQDCIRITASDVVFDGNSHTIDSKGSGYGGGISVHNSSKALSNVTIKNLEIEDWKYGIILENVYNSTIENNHAYRNTVGIELSSSSNNYITNNTVSSNEAGVSLWGTSGSSNNILTNNTVSNNRYGISVDYSDNNHIYNNLFNNTNNVGIYRSQSIWNTTKKPGTNIVGGKNRGGNAWLKPNGTGVSQICSDLNDDDICDVVHELDTSNIDYLPLAVGKPSEVGKCFEINAPGYYKLAEDIINCTIKQCITITVNDVILDGAGHTIDGGYANASIERFGIYVKNSSTGLSNVTIKNLNVTGWNAGIFFYGVKNSSIENNQVNNNKNGIYLDCSNHITLTNNTVYNNSDGIYYRYSSRTTIISNTICNNSVHGIILAASHNNTLTNNIINNNSVGIHIEASNNNDLIHNRLHKNSYGIHIFTSRHTAILTNNIHSSTYWGIHLQSENSTLIGNTVCNNGDSGVIWKWSENSTIENNTVYNNTRRGVVLSASHNSTLKNNRVWNNKRNGLSITLSNGTIIMNNNVYNNTLTGIELRDSNNNRLTNNSVSSNWHGIELRDSNNSTLTHSSIYRNSYDGLRFDKSKGNTLTYNTVYDNGDNGISLYNSNNVIYNNIFNNINNIYISASYTIWNTTKTPGTNIGGGGFLGGNAWLKPDGTGHSQTCNDSDYDGICDKEHNLNLINIDYLPLKVVNVSTCMNITSTGYYKLINDIYSSAPCCINITASGVIFDGNGHKIENSGIAGYSGHGICVYNTSTTLSNIIIKNVTVRRWDIGILMERVEESVIENNTAYRNKNGIKLSRSSNNTIINNSASSNTNGFYLVDSTNNIIMTNNASNNGGGIFLSTSNYSTIANNYLIGHSQAIYMGYSKSNTITNNTLLSNGEAISLSYSDSNIIANNNASDGTTGLYLIEYSHNNTIMNNMVSNNFGEGLRISYYSNNNTAINNTVDTNTNGIFLENTRNNTVGNNTIDHNSYEGMWIQDSNNNTVTKNNVCNNGNNGISLYSSNNNLIYLNNFIDNSYSILSSYSSNTFNSTNQIPYNYHIIEITGYMGNYWSDYTDVDTNGNGIWDNPYIINSDKDNYPLVEPFELYFID